MELDYSHANQLGPVFFSKRKREIKVTHASLRSVLFIIFKITWKLKWIFFVLPGTPGAPSRPSCPFLPSPPSRPSLPSAPLRPFAKCGMWTTGQEELLTILRENTCDSRHSWRALDTGDARRSVHSLRSDASLDARGSLLARWTPRTGRTWRAVSSVFTWRTCSVPLGNESIFLGSFDCSLQWNPDWNGNSTYLVVLSDPEAKEPRWVRRRVLSQACHDGTSGVF